MPRVVCEPPAGVQAMDRAHRIGQTRPVLVLRLCTANSVEVKLLKRANSKLALTRLVIKSGAFQGGDNSSDKNKASLTAQELLSVLQVRLLRPSVEACLLTPCK